jgi:hypothetical protein
MAAGQALAPRRVRLRLQGATVEAAARALSEQAGVAVEYVPGKRPAGAPALVTSELKGVSFWEALDRLGSAGRLVWSLRPDRRGLRLTDGEPAPAHLTAHSGQARFQLLRVSRQRNLAVEGGSPVRHERLAVRMGFMPEVGSALLKVGQPRVTRAEDSEGRPLAWVPHPQARRPGCGCCAAPTSSSR